MDAARLCRVVFGRDQGQVSAGDEQAVIDLLVGLRQVGLVQEFDA